jgi:hypothetical protein
MQNLHNEPHPIEVLILVALITAQALVELIVALVELLQRPAARRESTATPPAPPTLHPLATIANELETLPVTRLRPMAGVRGKRARKSELVAMVAACC